MNRERLACEIVGRAVGATAVDPEGDMQSIPGWDSLGHMAIVAEIENALGRTLAPEQIVSIGSIRDVALLLASGPAANVQGSRLQPVVNAGADK